MSYAVMKQPEFWYSLLLIIILFSGVVVRYKGSNLSTIFSHIAIWCAILLLLILAYSFRFEFVDIKNRIVAELLPDKGMSSDPKHVSFRMASDGHFYIKAKVNGVNIRFLVDTGASDIVLSPEDAIRVGYDLSTLKFNQQFQTANGIVSGAKVRLDSIEIPPIVIVDMPASVNGASMGYSLLGMRFLKRLKSYQVSQDRLTFEVP